MKRVVLLVLILVFNLYAEFDFDKLPSYSQDYNPKASVNKDLQEALKVAKQKDKNILLIVGGNWCKWCGTFDNFLDDHPKVANMLFNSFEVVKVYYGKGISKESKEFLKQLPPLKGTPHFYILNKDAKLLKSVDTAFLERGYGYNRKKVEEWIKQNRNLK